MLSGRHKSFLFKNGGNQNTNQIDLEKMIKSRNFEDGQYDDDDQMGASHANDNTKYDKKSRIISSNNSLNRTKNQNSLKIQKFNPMIVGYLLVFCIVSIVALKFTLHTSNSIPTSSGVSSSSPSSGFMDLSPSKSSYSPPPSSDRISVVSDASPSKEDKADHQIPKVGFLNWMTTDNNGNTVQAHDADDTPLLSTHAKIQILDDLKNPMEDQIVHLTLFDTASCTVATNVPLVMDHGLQSTTNSQGLAEFKNVRGIVYGTFFVRASVGGGGSSHQPSTPSNCMKITFPDCGFYATFLRRYQDRKNHLGNVKNLTVWSPNH